MVVCGFWRSAESPSAVYIHAWWKSKALIISSRDTCFRDMHSYRSRGDVGSSGRSLHDRQYVHVNHGCMIRISIVGEFLVLGIGSILVDEDLKVVCCQCLIAWVETCLLRYVRSCIHSDGKRPSLLLLLDFKIIFFYNEWITYVYIYLFLHHRFFEAPRSRLDLPVLVWSRSRVRGDPVVHVLVLFWCKYCCFMLYHLFSREAYRPFIFYRIVIVYRNKRSPDF